MRINIIGNSGSGKTTFGRQLAEALQVPFIELDAIFWGPAWTSLSNEDLNSAVAQALEGESWVLDGNYSRTSSIKWQRVQAVVWLDYSFPRNLYQALTRAVSRIISRKELWPGTGNRESIRKLFSRDSIVLYTIKSYCRTRRRFEAVMTSQEYSHIVFHQLPSPGKAKEFLELAWRDPGMLIQKG